MRIKSKPTIGFQIQCQILHILRPRSSPSLPLAQILNLEAPNEIGRLSRRRLGTPWILVRFLEVLDFGLVSGEGVDGDDPVLDLVGQPLLPRRPLVQHEEPLVRQQVHNLETW